MNRNQTIARFETLDDANEAVRSLLNAHVPARALRLVGCDGRRVSTRLVAPRRSVLPGALLGAAVGVTAGFALALGELVGVYGSEALLTPATLDLTRFGIGGGLLAGAVGGGLTGLGQWRMTPNDAAFEGPVHVTVAGDPWRSIARDVLSAGVLVDDEPGCRPTPDFGRDSWSVAL